MSFPREGRLWSGRETMREEEEAVLKVEITELHIEGDGSVGRFIR
jgi:hypothetical protein